MSIVYVIGEEAEPRAGVRAKIGYTGNGVAARLASGLTWNPNLKEWLSFEGNQNLERLLHELFASARLSGEWFYMQEITLACLFGLASKHERYRRILQRLANLSREQRQAVYRELHEAHSAWALGTLCVGPVLPKAVRSHVYAILESTIDTVAEAAEPPDHEDDA